MFQHHGSARGLVLTRRTVSLLTVLWGTALCAAHARAGFDNYQLQETFALPAGAGAFDVLPDGRLITTAGAELLLETAPGSRSFAGVGALAGADFNSFGPAFVRVSPDGSRVAIGNGGGASFGNYKVGVFSLAGLGGWYSLGHYDAEWANDGRLALTAGDFGDPARVDVLDAASPFAAPDVTTVISGIGGASGGITFDAAGRLYTANGFAGAGPSGTGVIRAFESSAWLAALSGGTAESFEAGGTLVGEALSGSSLGFDAAGNLHVGGGDFGSGDFGYAGLLRGSAVAQAVAGSGPVGASDTLALDPDVANPFNFYDTNYNAARGELYVREGGTVYTYLVPEPASLAVIAIGGLLALSRRRVAMRRSADRP